MLLREVSLQQHGFLVFVILPLEHKSCRKIIGALLLLLSKKLAFMIILNVMVLTNQLFLFTVNLCWRIFAIASCLLGSRGRLTDGIFTARCCSFVSAIFAVERSKKVSVHPCVCLFVTILFCVKKALLMVGQTFAMHTVLWLYSG